jgi:xanthosine utilization system XapX-like protein
MSPAGTVTWICVAVIEDGVSAALVPKFTVAPATKFVPVIVKVNAAPPAVALVGEIVVIVGDAVPVIVKVTAAELLALKVASPL